MPLPRQAAPPVDLNQYIQNYSSKLSSMMDGIRPPPPVNLPPETSQLAQPQAAPVQQAGPASQLAGPPAAAAPPQDSSPDHEASFRSEWKKMPEKERESQVDDFEQTLKKGNQTIDSAYDTMVQQLGQRPDGKMSKHDKAMMLMEFGLNLMANSAGDAYGKDLGGAIGASGLKVTGDRRSRLEGSQKEYDTRRLAIEGQRAGSKKDLALQSALETSKDQRAESADIRRATREGNTVAGTVTDPSNKVYSYTKSGLARGMKDENGNPVRERQPASALGAGGKGFEKEWAYNQYVKDHGTDPKTGQPLSGEAMAKVKEDALKYAGGLMKDTRTANQKNIADLQERGVPQSVAADIIYRLRDNPQKMQAALATALARTGMLDADEITAQAQQITESIVGESALEGARRPKVPDAPKPTTFGSAEEANAAIASGALGKGDVVTVGGKTFRVQ